jgi:tetratricopeptide (TPR) repeat protein
MKVKIEPRFSFILIFLYFSFVLHGQQTNQEKIDSIQLLIVQAKQTSNMSSLKSGLKELANYFEYDGNWTAYDSVINEMLKIANDEKDLDYEAECYNKWGISNCFQGKNKKAVEYFEKALVINKELNDSASISNSYENMGIVYKDLAEFDKALKYQMNSLKIREKIAHPRLVNTYANIAIIYKTMEDYEMEGKYIMLALKKVKEGQDNNPSNIAIIYNQLGGYCNRKQNIDSSIYCYEKVVEFSEKAGWKRGIAVGKGNLAELHSDNGNYPLAIAMHRDVLNLSIEIEDCMGIAEECTYLAALYETIDRLDSALYYSTLGLEKAYNCNLGKDKLNLLKQHSLNLESKGDIHGALEYYKRFHQLSDSLFNSEKQTIVSDLETKYQTEKKETEIKQLSTENELKSQRIKFAIAAIIAIAVAAGFVIFLLIMRRRKIRAEQEQLKQQLFRSQMNPHFMFNALASIQSFLYKNEAKKAASYLGNFSSLTRSILINSTKEEISLDEEIATLKNYIELERMRLKDAFDYDINFDEDLETEFIKIPPMLIQPFVENAIKHGLKEKKEGGKLSVSFTDKGDNLQVQVVDNGVGIDHSKKEIKNGHKSMALSIFNHRIKIIRKKSKGLPLPQIKDLSVESKQGTLVEIHLPIYQ